MCGTPLLIFVLGEKRRNNHSRIRFRTELANEKIENKKEHQG